MCSIEVSMSMSMERYGASIAMEVANWCANAYNIDEKDVMERLGRELNINIIKKEKEKVVKEKKEQSLALKSAFPLPFNGEHDESKCHALRQNNGLYTQCTSNHKDVGLFCKQCEKRAVKSEGVPEYGTIEQRMAVGIMDFVDPKGRKPTAYTKVMKKYNLNIEQVKEEAAKFGMTILEEHFLTRTDTKRGRPATKPKSEAKGVKGRPKKEKKVLQIEDEEDLFANLVASAEEEGSVMSDLSDTTKESQKQAKAAEKLAKEQEKAEKAAKLEADKAEKEAAKAAEKLAKEQEKAEKAAKLEAAKIAEKLAKESTKKEKKPVAVEEEEEEETYRKCSDTAGKKYIRSEQTNIVYDLDVYTESQELLPVGKWVGGVIIIKKTDDSDSELSEEEEEE